MKIKLTKHNMIRFAPPDQLEQFKAAGWSEATKQADLFEEKAQEEIIRLKPPVKTKATVKALDEANDKGDE